MSLRSFHLLFIIASISLSLLMSLWGGFTYASDRGTSWHIVTAVGAFVSAGLLALYLARFVQKTREIGY